MDACKMNNDAKERIKSIELYAKKQNEKKEQEKREKEAYFYSLNEEIKNLYPRISDLISVADACTRCFISISNFKRKDEYDLTPVSFDCKNNVLLVAMAYTRNGETVYAGQFGLCNKNGTSIIANSGSLEYDNYIPAMEKFINGFAEFEGSFYNYVDHFIEINY